MTIDAASGECHTLSASLGCFADVIERRGRVFGLTRDNARVVELGTGPARAQRVDVGGAKSVGLAARESELVLVTENQVIAKRFDGDAWEAIALQPPLPMTRRAFPTRTRIFAPDLSGRLSSIAWGASVPERGHTSLELSGAVSAAIADPEHPDCAYAARRLGDERGELVRVCRSNGPELTDGRLELIRPLEGAGWWELYVGANGLMVYDGHGVTTAAGAPIPLAEPPRTICGLKFAAYANGVTVVTHPGTTFELMPAFFRRAP